MYILQISLMSESCTSIRILINQSIVCVYRDLIKDEQVKAGVSIKDLSGYDAQETQNPEANPCVNDGPVAYRCHEEPDGLFCENWCGRQVRVQ
jgi:hypothetical protein